MSIFAKERVAFSVERNFKFGEQEKLCWILQNGLLLCALVKSQAPQVDEINLDTISKENSPVKAVQLAFTTAEKYLNIFPPFSAQGVVDCKVDDEALFGYLSNFLKIPMKPSMERAKRGSVILSSSNRVNEAALERGLSTENLNFRASLKFDQPPLRIDPKPSVESTNVETPLRMRSATARTESTTNVETPLRMKPATARVETPTRTEPITTNVETPTVDQRDSEIARLYREINSLHEKVSQMESEKQQNNNSKDIQLQLENTQNELNVLFNKYTEDQKKWVIQREEQQFQMKKLQDQKQQVESELKMLKKEKEADSSTIQTKALLDQFNDCFKALSELLFLDGYQEAAFVGNLTIIGKMMGEVSAILGAESEDANVIVDGSKAVMKQGIMYKRDSSEENKLAFFSRLCQLAKHFELIKIRNNFGSDLDEVVRGRPKSAYNPNSKTAWQ